MRSPEWPARSGGAHEPHVTHISVAERITWVEGDLATWTAPSGHFDLVVCLYVHVAGDVEEMVRRMADAVAVGGTLFIVGHRPIDPTTGTLPGLLGGRHLLPLLRRGTADCSAR